MARLLEYENYKDLNGVKIPDSWELSKVKYLANYLNGFAFKPAHWTDEGIPIIRIQNLTNQNADINKTSFIAPERYHVVEGDILISWSATLDVYMWQGKKAWLNQHIYKVKVNRNKIIEKYFYWTAKWFMGELNESSHGSTMQHLTTDKFGSFNVPLPPISEQHLITNFLDHETAQIDTLIEKQRTLIQLLKEKRQAVISHAVTKGLNPDAPMKDSGVEFLSEVPEHWKVAKLKFYTNQIVDGAHFTPTYTNEGVPFLRVTDIHNDSINMDAIKYIPRHEHEALIKRCNPQKGDLLLSKNGTIGIPKVIDWEWEFSIFVSLCLIKFKESLTSQYAEYFFKSHEIKEQISGLVKQSTVINLHLDKIQNFWFSIPPINEQYEIVAVLNKKIDMFDSLVGKAEQAIQLMQERRTALISAAVTGKIDVRGWVAPE